MVLTWWCRVSFSDSRYVWCFDCCRNTCKKTLKILLSHVTLEKIYLKLLKFIHFNLKKWTNLHLARLLLSMVSNLGNRVPRSRAPAEHPPPTLVLINTRVLTFWKEESSRSNGKILPLHLTTTSSDLKHPLWADVVANRHAEKTQKNNILRVCYWDRSVAKGDDSPEPGLAGFLFSNSCCNKNLHLTFFSEGWKKKSYLSWKIGAQKAFAVLVKKQQYLTGTLKKDLKVHLIPVFVDLFAGCKKKGFVFTHKTQFLCVHPMESIISL